MPPPPSPHQQLEALFEQLTEHLSALDRDIDLALSEYYRFIHRKPAPWSSPSAS